MGFKRDNRQVDFGTVSRQTKHYVEIIKLKFCRCQQAHFFFSPSVQFRTTVSASGDVFASFPIVIFQQACAPQ